LQEGLFFNLSAVEAKRLVASLESFADPFANDMLGTLDMLHVTATMFLQQGGSGQVPIPFTSTGWHSDGVISCLSLKSGTPSPSVSLLTP
jgi:hypothetical protein